MAWTPLTTTDIASGKFLNQTRMQKIKDSLEYLYGIGTAAYGWIPNGNFEIDSDSDGVPDGWTSSTYPGGIAAFETTSPMEGAKSWKMVHPGGTGNGGGTLTSGYIECSPAITYCLYFLHYATAAGMKNQVQIQFYTAAKIINGSAVNLYNSVANPTSASWISRPFTPPAGSYYFKLILVGGYIDIDVTGTAYFDDINLIRMIPGAGLPEATAIDNSCAALVVDYPTLAQTTSGSWTTLHSWKINRTGTYNIKFTLTIFIPGPGATAYGRIYKNGIAFGTLRGVAADVPPAGSKSVVFAESLSFSAGDIIDFKAYMTGSADGAGISALLFYANDHTFASKIS